MLAHKSADLASVRVIEDADDLAETRLEAIGYIYHGHPTPAEGKVTAKSMANNLLHFARCPKVDKLEGERAFVWFRTIRIACQHLNERVGPQRWRWCKHCQREVTQRLLNE